ncbi:MAG: class I SAM-dependent methyltransferase [Chloroflexaceae bacterium]|jgi:SAM-dependent methyltransferase|nr:class I SAM-dependent methyltransferase [Chloroflexaceae bacterium]
MSELHHTRWEQFYREDQRTATAPPSLAVNRAAEAFGRARVCSVLDLGCGAGRDTVLLAQRGFAVVGTDLARSGLRMARQRAATERIAIDFACAGATQLPFPSATFGGVYCFGLLHEFTFSGSDAVVALVMQEVRRVLRPGGLLALAVLAGDPAAGLSHVRLFNEAMARAAFQGFTITSLHLLNDVGCTGRAGYGVWYGEGMNDER